MRGLLIEENQATAEGIARLFARNNMQVASIPNGTDVLSHITAFDPDFIILNARLPNTGVSLVCKIRRHSSVPLIAVAEVSGKEERVAFAVELLRAGADDFLAIDKKQLIREEERLLPVKTIAVLRRSRNSALKVDYTYGALRHRIGIGTWINDQPIPWTRSQLQIMDLLAARRGRVLSGRELFAGQSESLLRAHICKMRQLLKQLSGGESYIEVRWGFGYLLPQP